MTTYVLGYLNVEVMQTANAAGRTLGTVKVQVDIGSTSILQRSSSKTPLAPGSWDCTALVTNRRHLLSVLGLFRNIVHHNAVCAHHIDHNNFNSKTNIFRLHFMKGLV